MTSDRGKPAHVSPRLARAMPPIIILTFAVAVTYRFALLHHTLYWGDVSLYFAPILEFERQVLVRGRLPLWNPYMLCGQPLVGNPQSWVFYPGTVLLAALSTWRYLALNTTVHVAVAGMGMYLFVRRITGDRMAGVLGAATYCGSGFLAARMQFPAMVQCAALMPYLVLLTDRVIMRPGYRDVGLLGLVVALTLLAGHPQVAHMSLLASGAYAVACLWRIRRHRTRMRAACRGLAIALAAGIATAGVQVLPGLQLYVQSTRSDLTIFGANRFVLLPGQIITLVFPYWFGSPNRGDYWGAGNIWEPCLYCGILPLALAILAMRHGARRHAVRFFIVLCVVTLWLAFGRQGGLYWIAYYAIPGQSAWHDPARFVFLFTFAMAVLAGIGMRLLRDRHMAPRYRAAIVLLAMVDLAVFASGFNPTVSTGAYRYRPRALAVTPEPGRGRTYSTLREGVWQRYVNYADYGPESTRYANEITYTMSPNIGMRFGVEEASGYEPVPTDHIGKVDALVRASLVRQSPRLEQMLGLTNSAVVFLPQSTRMPHPALVPIAARGVGSYAVRRPAPRAWLVRHTVRIDSDDRSLAALSSPAFDPARTATVVGASPLEDWPDAVPAPAGPVDARVGQGGAMDIRADAGAAPAVLVASAAAYPGWTARVDGRPARVLRVDHAFLGVTLPPGPHRVQLEYRPFAVRLGLYVTLLGATLVAGALAFGGAARVLRRGRAAGIARDAGTMNGQSG